MQANPLSPPPKASRPEGVSLEALTLLERLEVLRSRLRLLKVETGLLTRSAWPDPARAVARSCLAFESPMPQGHKDWSWVQTGLLDLCSGSKALFGPDVDLALRIGNTGSKSSLNFFWPAHSGQPYKGSVLLEVSTSRFQLFWVDRPCLESSEVATDWSRAAMSFVLIGASLARATGAEPAVQFSGRWATADSEMALVELSLSSEGLHTQEREQSFLAAIQAQLACLEPVQSQPG